MIFNIGVKDLVRFLYSGGDLNSEFFINKKNNDAHNAHLYLQKKYNEQSNSEVYVKYTTRIGEDEVNISGFIDGLLDEEGKIIIEEIKSTSLALNNIKEDYHPEYLAQAKMYAYMYLSQSSLGSMGVRLTYINLDSYETKAYEYEYVEEDLQEFFDISITKYLAWQHTLKDASDAKLASIQKMEFPFKQQRAGQRDLMKATFYAMTNEEIMYAIAPTGIGKTMATLFSSLKSIVSNDEKIFYLTAKGTGKKVAVNAVKLLMDKGLKIKTLVLNSKTKGCLNAVKNCDPEKCRFAKGFFDRLKNATEDIFMQTDLFDNDTVSTTAIKYEICNFEFALYLSYFCDLIIADYNYAFDPRAHLIRYFDDDSYKPKLLIDEAHNLISRSKDMYSTTMSTSTIKELRTALTKFKPGVKSEITNLLKQIESYKEKITKDNFYFDVDFDETIYNYVKKICTKCEQIFADNKEFATRDVAIDCYFELKDYLLINDLYSINHRFMIKKDDEGLIVCLNCLDASTYLLDIIKNRCFGVVFFSATLYPLDYHMDLLTKSEGKYIILDSPFKQNNLDLIIRDDISTKYVNREKSLDDIVNTIKILAHSKVGNYIAFFPSYQYLTMVEDALADSNLCLIVQRQNLSEFEREIYFDKFKDSSKTQVGLFVMGSIFSEGLDFIGDLLSGVVIVGVGLPQINNENNILKDFFEEKYNKGFDYAYTYPGFTKVVQAAGRVIRSETDRGVVILIDERFGYSTYRRLMPKQWLHYKRIKNENHLKKELEEFWNGE